MSAVDALWAWLDDPSGFDRDEKIRLANDRSHQQWLLAMRCLKDAQHPDLQPDSVIAVALTGLLALELSKT